MVCMPPRHGKTELGAMRFPLYHLLRRPSENVLVTGYNQTFANRIGRRLRNEAVRLGLPVADDSRSVSEFEVSGRSVVARGVGAPPTGIGFGLIDIDDPVKSREQADSERFRERMLDWYTDDLTTRLEPGGAIVMTLTRWHEDDLAGRVLAREPGRWEVLKLPAIAGDDDPLGREPGAALWPERFPAEALAEIRERMRREEGEYSYEALFQQDPTPRTGSLFDVLRIGYCEVVPAGLPAVRGWDLAATTGSGDQTAGVKLEGPDQAGLYYVSDVVAGNWGATERDRTIRQTAEKDGRAVPQDLPQDPGQAGKSQAQAFYRLLAGFDVRTSPETGSKEVRAAPVASQVGAGNLVVVKGHWNADFVEQLRTFPYGKRDDQVDALSRAFARLAVPSWGEVFSV